MAINADIVDINGTMKVGAPTDYDVTINNTAIFTQTQWGQATDAAAGDVLSSGSLNLYKLVAGGRGSYRSFLGTGWTFQGGDTFTKTLNGVIYTYDANTNLFTQQTVTTTVVNYMDCLASDACRPQLGLKQTADGLYILRDTNKGINTASVSGNVNVYYDAALNELVLGGIASGGGASVAITGQIINTVKGGGNIQVSSGDAWVTVTNQTGLTLNTQNIDTTSSSAKSVVMLGDTLRKETNWYVYDPASGLIQYTAKGTGYKASAYTGTVSAVKGNTATYTPKEGVRYQWSYTATMARDTSGTWEFNKLDSNTAASSTIANQYWAFNGALLITDTSLKDVAFTESITGSFSDWRKYAQVIYSALGKKDEIDLIWDWYIPTTASITATASVKADNPITISFSGGHDKGNVAVTSAGSVVVQGNIYNPTGATSITTTGADSHIGAGEKGIINTQSLALNTQNGIGSVETPLVVNLLNRNGEVDTGMNTVSAVTKTGDIALRILGSNDALLRKVWTDSKSDVWIAADDSLRNAAPAGEIAIRGRNITLSSVNGGMGLDGKPLLIDALETINGQGVTSGGVVNANAAASIWLEEANGDMAVGNITSTTGDVWLRALAGSIVNGDGRDLSDRTEQLAALWDKLDLIDRRDDKSDITTSAAYAKVILPYQNSINAQYQGYATLKALGAVSEDGRTFTLSPDADTAALQAQADAWNAANGSALTLADYAQYRFDSLRTALDGALADTRPDWQSDFDADYVYAVSDAQIAAMTAGQYWTTDALAYAINVAALQPVSTVVTDLPYVNVQGANVTLISNKGSIGAIGQDVDFAFGDSGVLSNLTTEQKAALATANSAGDVINQQYTRISGLDAANCTVADADCRLVSFSIRQNNPLYASVSGVLDGNGKVSGGLTARATATEGDVFVQAQGMLPIVEITAGRNAVVMSEAGMINTSPNAVAITTGGNLDLQNGSGDIGSNLKEMTLKVGNLLQSARSGGNLFLAVPQGDLHFLNIVAGNLVWLRTTDGDLYGDNMLGGEPFASLAGQALSLHVSGSVHGASADAALLTILGDDRNAGILSGSTNGDLLLSNSHDLDIGRAADAGIYPDGEDLTVGGELLIDNAGHAVNFIEGRGTKVGGNMMLTAAAIGVGTGSDIDVTGSAQWTAQGAISGDGELHAKNTATLAAGGDIGALDKRLRVDAAAIDATSTNGAIALALTRSATRIDASAAGDIDLTAVGGFAFGGLASAGGNVRADAAGGIAGDTVTAAQDVTLTADDDMQLGQVAASRLNATAGGGLSIDTARIAGDGDLRSGGDMRLGDYRGRGDLSALAGGGLTGRTVEVAGAASLTGAALVLGDVRSGGDLMLAAKTGGIGYASLASTGGDVRADAAGSITGRSITAARDVSLISGGDIAGDTIAAGCAVTLGAAGTVSLGTLDAGCTAAVRSRGDTLLGEVVASRLQATAGGALSIDTARIAGDGDLRSGGDMRLGDYRGRGDLSALAGGRLTGRTVAVAGAASLTGAALALGDVRSGGDLMLAAKTGGIGYASLASTGGDVRADAAGSITGRSITAARDVSLVSGGDIAGDTMEAGRDATLEAGGSIDIATLTGGRDATLLAGNRVGLGSLTVGGLFTLLGARDFAAGSITADALDMSASGSIALGDAVIGRAISVRTGTLTGRIRATGAQPFRLDVRGYADIYADSVTLDVDAPAGLQFQRLWTDYGNIVTTTGQVAILDGRVRTSLSLTTPFGQTLMNNVDARGVAGSAV
ncbi:MAG: hypothetical protein LBV50_00645 [Novosphingobium sp.]|nr:hypothetical protein [Novosphingobium sp.]